VVRANDGVVPGAETSEYAAGLPLDARGVVLTGRSHHPSRSLTALLKYATLAQLYKT